MFRAVVLMVKPHARFVGIHDANFDQRFLLEFVMRQLPRRIVRATRLRLMPHRISRCTPTARTTCVIHELRMGSRLRELKLPKNGKSMRSAVTTPARWMASGIDHYAGIPALHARCKSPAALSAITAIACSCLTARRVGRLATFVRASSSARRQSLPLPA